MMSFLVIVFVHALNMVRGEPSGRLAKPGEFPSSVWFECFEICGGTLLTMDKVVTAAHCLVLNSKECSKEKLLVIGGSMHSKIKSDGYQASSVTEYRLHDGYKTKQLANGPYTYFDIALMTLTTPFTESIMVKSATFPDSDIKGIKKSLEYGISTGISCFITGFGVLGAEGPGRTFADDLQVTELRMLPSDKCRVEKEMEDYEVCGETVGKNDFSTPGDCGSSLVCGGQTFAMVKGILNEGADGKDKESLTYVFSLIGPYIEVFNLDVNDGSSAISATQYIITFAFFNLLL